MPQSQNVRQRPIRGGHRVPVVVTNDIINGDTPLPVEITNTPIDVDVNSLPSGGFLNDFSLEISRGNVPGMTFIHKFGNAPDFDTGDNVISVWDGADDAHIDQMTYVYSTVDDIDSVSSDDNSDTQDVEIQGLDSNYDLVVQTITLTGQTRKALDTDLLRVFRIKNVGVTDNAGHIYCYVNSAITNGTPNDPTQVRAVVQPGMNQTLMAIYTIPNGKTGYMRSWYAAQAGANKTTNYIVDLRARPVGQVFQLKHRSSLEDQGTTYIQHHFKEPEMFAAKTDIEMRVDILAIGVSGASVSAGFDLVLVDD